MRQAISTKFIGPTNHRGSRVKATCDAGSITVPWEHGLDVANNHTAAAMALANKLDWPGEWYGGSVQTGYVYVCADVGGWTGLPRAKAISCST